MAGIADRPKVKKGGDLIGSNTNTGEVPTASHVMVFPGATETDGIAEPPGSAAWRGEPGKASV